MQRSAIAALLAGSMSIAYAQAPAKTPAPAATAVWARATAGGQTTGAAYLTLTSPAPDRLVGASTSVADVAEVHENVMDGTVMRMRAIPALDLPANQPVVLAPGGYHVMLMHLHAPLVAGQTFPLHLVFARSEPLDVTVTVGRLGASGPGEGGREGGR